MSITPTFDGLTVGNTYGALLLGTFFSLVLYGLILHQTYRYIRLHPHDYTYIQVLVASSLILETLHTVCTMHANYHALVTNYFNPIALLRKVWSLNALILTGELSKISTFPFFIRRLYFIPGNSIYTVVLSTVFLAVDLGFSLGMTIRLFQSTDLATFLTVVIKDKETYLVQGKFAAAVATHIMLTGSLVYAVHRGQKTRKERKSVADLCMLYVVNTGLLVSVVDVIAWIIASVQPGTGWWIGLLLVTVKLYMVTFLAVSSDMTITFISFSSTRSLNSRQQLLARGGIDIFGTDSTTERNFISRAQLLATAERYNAPQLPERAPTRIDIKVATEVEEGDAGEDSLSRTSHSSMIIEEGKVVRM
ncbi:hypothetical protein GSI_05580 [Ganoderma sinense ZZ0214-1]|uniref:DUF6534 domain-containing protein n=1 Tax=Ganoderma sinense ZZ0214-1 TaxID=1077348 RepID=A0A2G8SEX8_9APHY|nr:hypothetical protein GSI_05580 [Ganoderma sinense ZZ0214-1]